MFYVTQHMKTKILKDVSQQCLSYIGRPIRLIMKPIRGSESI